MQLSSADCGTAAAASNLWSTACEGFRMCSPECAVGAGIEALTALSALTRLSLGSADGVAVAGLAQRLPALADLRLKFGFAQEQEHNAQARLDPFRMQGCSNTIVPTAA